MPEESFEEKTEQPTPKRLREARERGSVAKSTELNSAIILLLGFSFLFIIGHNLMGNLMDSMKVVFEHANKVDVSVDALNSYYITGFLFFLKLIGPFMAFVMVLGIAMNILQVGFLFSSKPLELDLAKLSPLRGMKNLVSLRGIVEALKGFIKVFVVVLVCYLVIKGDLQDIFSSADYSVGQILVYMGKEMYKIGIISSLILLVMAIFDYAFQRWSYMKSLRMTKQELKEERKDLEGDPLIKARVRSLQREMARRRMMEEVPKATVVVTNPTFIAIALQYEPAEMSAPKVLAKGKRLIAERIRKIATEHGIPIVEDKPLARSLYDVVEPGDEIPPAYFAPVAEILAYVYRLKNKKVA